jgi:hypothetical protein
MGFWRTLYREARDVIGLPPPAETDDQRAERIRDEVAGDLGGRKSREGAETDAAGAWVLATELEGRAVVLTFRGDGHRVHYRIGTTLGGGPPFRLVAESHGDFEPGGAVARKSVGTALNLEAGDAETLATLELCWKTLPTGTRGNLASLVSRLVGRFTFEGDDFSLDAEAESLIASGAASQIRSQARTLARLVGEIEQAWSAL